MAAAPHEQELPQEDMGTLFAQKKEPSKRQRIEYYAEEQFQGANLNRSVHVGWGACIGAAIILFCMGMSAVTQGRSWNVSFLWLQRRVGAQFGTMTYMITSNSMYYHDGDKWVTRDWAKFGKRFQALTSAAARGPPLTACDTGVSRGFAAGGLREG